MVECEIGVHSPSMMAEWAGGATVARSIPDRKVACSNHVRLTTSTLTTLLFGPGSVYFIHDSEKYLGKGC